MPIPIRDAPFSFGVKRLICAGAYEAPERELVARILRPGMNVVEMGGSIGIVTAIIASRIKPGGSLVSVEASEALVDFSRPWLERQFAHVRVVQGYAFPVLHLPAGLTVKGFENHGVSLGGQVTYMVAPGATAAVTDSRTYDIAGLCEMTGVRSPDVLVADIEGSESVLLVPGVELPSSLLHVVIELHPGLYPNGTTDRERMIRFFHDHGLPLRHQLGACYLFSRDEADSAA